MWFVASKYIGISIKVTDPSWEHDFLFMDRF